MTAGTKRAQRDARFGGICAVGVGRRAGGYLGEEKSARQNNDESVGLEVGAGCHN